MGGDELKLVATRDTRHVELQKENTELRAKLAIAEAPGAGQVGSSPRGGAGRDQMPPTYAVEDATTSRK